MKSSLIFSEFYAPAGFLTLDLSIISSVNYDYNHNSLSVPPEAYTVVRLLLMAHFDVCVCGVILLIAPT